jgi:hypothetical protein
LIAKRTVQSHIDSHLGNSPRAKIKDLLDCLNQLPEYGKTPAGPVARVGSNDDYCGRIFVTMAGGTGGGINVYKAYFEAGIGTLVVMHAKEDVIKAVKEQNIGNIVVAGHMASDSIGMNGLLCQLEAGGIEVIRMAGIIDPN